MSNNLDQFYTRKVIAQKYYDILRNRVDLDSFDSIIEPSAGNGSFFNLLPPNKRLGIDLDPKCDGVIKMDYLDYKPPPNKRILVAGNPPFGVNSKSAVLFFNHSATFADVIAFIIPRTWKRSTVQNKLSMDFVLLLSEDLPERGIFIPENRVFL